MASVAGSDDGVERRVAKEREIDGLRLLLAARIERLHEHGTIVAAATLGMRRSILEQPVMDEAQGIPLVGVSGSLRSISPMNVSIAVATATLSARTRKGTIYATRPALTPARPAAGEGIALPGLGKPLEALQIRAPNIGAAAIALHRCDEPGMPDIEAGLVFAERLDAESDGRSDLFAPILVSGGSGMRGINAMPLRRRRRVGEHAEAGVESGGEKAEFAISAFAVADDGIGLHHSSPRLAAASRTRAALASMTMECAKSAIGCSQMLIPPARPGVLAFAIVLEPIHQLAPGRIADGEEVVGRAPAAMREAEHAPAAVLGDVPGKLVQAQSGGSPRQLQMTCLTGASATMLVRKTTLRRLKPSSALPPTASSAWTSAVHRLRSPASVVRAASIAAGGAAIGS